MTTGRPSREDSQGDSLENDPGLDIALLQRRRDRTLTTLAVGLLLAVMAGTAYWVMRSHAPDAEELRGIAQEAVKRTVQDQLGPNLLCRFGEASETRVERTAEDAYDVSAEVSAVGLDGRGKRFSYLCSVKRSPEGNWEAVKVTLTPM